MSTIHLEPLQSEGLFYCFTCGECFLVNIWSTNYRKYPYKSPRFTLFTFDNKKQKILGNKRLPALLVFTVCYFKLMSYPSPPEAGSLFHKRKGAASRDAAPLYYWSRRWELNPRPTDYESVALPLSYAGLL